MWVNYSTSTLKKAEKWSWGQICNLYSSAPSPLLYKEHLQLGSKWDLYSKRKTQMQLFLAKRYFFETGDNVGRLLAVPVPRLGYIISDPVVINNIFCSFYSTCFFSHCPQMSEMKPPTLPRLGAIAPALQ